jgi:hypothetical protein
VTAPRYTGDLAELRNHPGFDWSMPAMGTWLRETALREADGALERARRLEADRESHQRVFAAYAAAENLAAAYPDDQAHYAAALDAYATRHQLRGWYRRDDGRGGYVVEVNFLRTAADGDVGRYFAYSSDPGVVVDRDTGRVVARFTGPRMAEMARSWVYQKESGGC